ncbi:MAG: response regulator [Pseudomonadota bacterium]|nr:response regulator [Pseudomonadota bacterium]
MRGFRIVLVEDDAIIATLLAEMLIALGHDVCATVTTEVDAVIAAARHAPDLMIVDVQLAPGNGVSAMRAILRNTAMPHVFITGGSRQSIPADATVLQKPFGESGLVRALGHVIASVGPGSPDMVTTSGTMAVGRGVKHVQS